MKNTNAYEDGVNVGDSLFGYVSSRCQKGVYLDLENGQRAFSYKCANLLPGSKALVTILRLPVDNRRILVSIDSVVSAFA